MLKRFTNGAIENDRIGSQYLKAIKAAWFALTHNMEFIYHPIAKYEHVCDDQKNDPDLLKKMNDFTNMQYIFKVFDSNEDNDILSLENILGINISVYQYDLNFFKNIDRYIQSNLHKSIVAGFWMNKQPLFTDDRFHIVLHMRVTNDYDCCESRIKSNQNIETIRITESIASQICEEFADKNPIVHVISQKKFYTTYDKRIFAKYPTVQYHIDTAWDEAFQMMVEADVLFASSSMFSFVPALLNTKLVKCHHLYFNESGIHGYPKGHHVTQVF